MSDLRERLIEAGAHGLDPQPWQRVGHEEAHRHDEVAAAVVNAAWPIIEAELQKRDREIEQLGNYHAELNELRINVENMASHTEDKWKASGLEAVGTMLRMWFLEAMPEMKQRARKAETALTEANKFLEQTIEVLEEAGGVIWQHKPELWAEEAKPLLDNLKALKKEGTE